jgi:hypothetical protein
MNTTDNKLTPDQIANWRKMLLGLVGPYAMLMSDEEIHRVRDDLQSRVGEESDESHNKSL